jgi:hypothetical protein
MYPARMIITPALGNGKGNPKEKPVAARTSHLHGGAKEARTPDPLLAKQVLSQLSYNPIFNEVWWA